MMKEMEDTRDNVYIKTEPADEEFGPENAGQVDSGLSVDMVMGMGSEQCDQQVLIKTEPGTYFGQEPIPSSETQNSGAFSSNIGYIRYLGYIKTEPKCDHNDQNFHPVDNDRIEKCENLEDYHDRNVAKIKTELDEELVLKEEPDSLAYTQPLGDDVGLPSDSDAGHLVGLKKEPDSLAYTQPKEDNVGLPSDSDAGHLVGLKKEPDSLAYTQPEEDDVGLPSDSDASFLVELKLKEESWSPPQPVSVPAAESRGLLRIDVEDPLHPVQSGIVKKEEPEEEMELDPKALDFDVVKVEHEVPSLSPSYTAPASGLSCEPAGENGDTSSDQHDAFEGLYALNSSSSRSPGEVTAREHILAEGKFKCDQCGEAYKCFQYYKMHQRVHTGQKTFKCDLCPEVFSRFNSLKQHIAFHCSKFYKCPRCDRAFGSQKELAAHKCKRQYACSECDEKFPLKSLRDVHKNIHFDRREKPLIFECNRCGEKFSEWTEYNGHRRCHQHEKTLKCGSCDKMFRYHNELIKHERIHTGERPFKCDQCAYTFMSLGALNAHKQRAHAPEMQFKCCHCDQVFTRSRELVRHQHIHSKEKQLKCDVCNEAFRYWNELARHRRIHSGGKPFACDQCDKAFTQKCHLILHQLTHTGEKPFKCDKCPKAYRRSYYLAEHQRIHSKEKAFKCDQCSKAFKQSRPLVVHQRTCTRMKTLKISYDSYGTE